MTQTPFAAMFYLASSTRPAPATVLAMAFARTVPSTARRTGRDSRRRTPARRAARSSTATRRAA